MLISNLFSYRTLLFCLFIINIVLGKEFHAVCVGINDYPGSGNDLDWCVADASEIRLALINEQGWSSNNVELLTDANATESRINQEIQNMPNAGDNTELFSFSGHGDSEELGGSDGIIPVNSLSARITPSELQNLFGSSYYQYCCFIDACGSGIFPGDMSRGVISSACRADELASESGELENGVFSYYIIDGIDNSNASPVSGGIISAEDIHDYASPLTTQFKPSQHPQKKDNYSPGKLNFRPVTTTGTLLSNETWNWNVCITGDVTIPDGVTLTISPGKKVYFPNGTDDQSGGYSISKSELNVYGKLIANGTASQRIEFTSLNQGMGDWFHIYFNDYTDVGSSIKYCNIRNSYYAIDIDMAPNLTIDHCTIENSWIGIYIYESTPTISNNSIFFCDGCGIYIEYINYISGQPKILNNEIKYNEYVSGITLVRSSAEIRNNQIYQNGDGIKCHTYSSPTLGLWNVPGYNSIHDNQWTGLFANYYSNPMLGFYYGQGVIIAGYNSFENNDSYHIDASTYCNIKAEYNWWGSAEPPFPLRATNHSSIDYEPFLYYDPLDLLSHEKLSQSINSIYDNNSKRDIKQNSEVKLKDRLSYALYLLFSNKILETQSLCKNIIEMYPDSSMALYALNILWQASTPENTPAGFGLDSFEDYLRRLLNKKEQKELYAIAGIILAGFEGQSGVLRLDNIIETYSNTYIAEIALFCKFSYYFNENDLMKAEEIANQINLLFPNSFYANEVSMLLGNPRKNMNNEMIESIDKKGIMLSGLTELVLSRAYPNPFNLSTKISFTLSKPLYVELNIYSVTGQRIVTLVKEQLEKGYHTVTWKGQDGNGNSVASGLYIYELLADGKRLVNKMFLMK